MYDTLTDTQDERLATQQEVDRETEIAQLWGKYNKQVCDPWDDNEMDIDAMHTTIAALTTEAIAIEADDLLDELDDASQALVAIQIQKRIDDAAKVMQARIRLANGHHGMFIAA